METIRTYSIEGTEYELYISASGDYCVAVSKYGEEEEDYYCGSYADALELILSYYECKEEGEEEE